MSILVSRYGEEPVTGSNMMPEAEVLGYAGLRSYPTMPYTRRDMGGELYAFRPIIEFI